MVANSQRKISKFKHNFNLTQKNPWCINYNQYIQNKVKNILQMKAINSACYKMEEKATTSVKNNKNNSINVIGDKFAISSISWGKLTISFWKKLSSYINYLQLIM